MVSDLPDLLCTGELVLSSWLFCRLASGDMGVVIEGRGEWMGEQRRLLRLPARLRECFWRTLIMASFSHSCACIVLTLEQS